MNKRPIVLCLLGASLLAGAGKKTLPSGRGESESVEVTGVLYTAKEDIQALLGSDLGGHYTVIQVRVASRFGREIEVRRDDFLLRTDKDGEKSTPFAASQIAGRGALVISQKAGAGSEGGGVQMGSPTTYPGDYPPGSYPGGYPTPGIAGGGGDTDKGSVQATARSSARDKVNPLEKILGDRMLPTKKTDQPVSGLLYFPMEKQKMKDLELVYGGRENRITLRFK